MTHLLKQENYQEFFNSKLVEEAHDLLNAAKVTRKSPGSKQFTLCRDYLTSTLILRNGARPGAVRNMTFGEFQTGIKSIQGNWQGSVKDHKTRYKGPAVPTFSNFEYEECSIYIARIRNRLAGIDYSTTAPVFVSWNGRKMSSSLLGDQFTSFFSKGNPAQSSFKTKLSHNCNFSQEISGIKDVRRKTRIETRSGQYALLYRGHGVQRIFSSGKNEKCCKNMKP